MRNYSEIEQQIRGVLQELEISDNPHSLDREADLYDAGMTSLASVRLMLALENAFDLEYPDELLQREYFSSVRAISKCIYQILTGEQV